MGLEVANPLETRSVHEPGAAIWHHEIFQDGKKSGAMLDFVDAQLPVFWRRVQSEMPLRFHLQWAEGAQIVQNGARYAAQWGATGALAKRAEAEFARLNREEQTVARRLFSRLMRVARPEEAG